MGRWMVLGFSGGTQQVGWAILTVGVLLVTAALVMGIRKRKRRAGGRITARENLERFKARTEVRDDLGRVMVEVEEMANRVSAQLDAKTIMIERMIDAADQRIARLDGLLRVAGDGEVPEAPAPGAVATGRTSPPDTEGADALARRVYDLADSGLEPAAIARQIDEHIGKVELILALRSA